ncbi:hypothetical protein C0993_008695, partial [Termitomyces sp. T159_Od127]
PTAMRSLSTKQAPRASKLQRRRANLTLADIELAKTVLLPQPSPARGGTGSASPVPSMSSSSSARSASLPTTPTSLDQPFHPVPIKPLVIHKRPLPPMPHDASDSDSDSDSEWYSRELSKIVTLRSSTPPDARSTARPDSMCISEPPASPRRRPPPAPPPPKRAPPSRPAFLPFAPRRPPPRSSVPADCVLIDDTFAFSDDSDALSLSLSPCSLHSPCPSPFPPSSPSTPAHEFDFPLDECRLDADADADAHTHTHTHEPPRTAPDAQRGLRSRWSSSTLGSVRAEHPRRGAIGVALRAYFAAPGARLKSAHTAARRAASDPLPTQCEDVMVIGFGRAV